MKIEDFKIGQKVKKVGGESYLGEIATVEAIGSVAIKLVFEDPSIQSCYRILGNPEWWEPVLEKGMNITAFKLGQRVQSTRDEGCLRGTVIEISSSGNNVSSSALIHRATIWLDNGTNRHQYFYGSACTENWEEVPSNSTLQDALERFDYISEFYPTIKMVAKESRLGRVWLGTEKSGERQAGVHLSSEGLRQMAQDLVAIAAVLDQEGN